jgi:hypothetical protein
MKRRINKMKAKKFTRKLRLNKETVADLNNDLMAAVKGGMYTVRVTCTGYCDTYETCEDATICGICWTEDPTICGGCG